jgi:hypothetical protein
VSVRSPRTAAALAATLLLAACGGPRAPWTEPPATKLDLEVVAEPTTVQLLQPVTLTLDLFAAAGVDVDFAPSLDAGSFVVATDVRPAVELHGGRWHRTVLTCRPVRGPGELVVPPFTAKSRDGAHAASTPELTITVTSALAGAAAGIEAPGDPFPTPFRGWWWVAAAAAGLVAGAAMWRWARSTRTRRGDADEVALPAHVKAMRTLQRLRTAPRTTPAEIDAFYVDVSAVLRAYLEERFGLHAPHRTTEEFLRELEAGDGLAKEHRLELERFLTQCDLVKFAALVPGEREHVTTWELAAAFVEATRADRAAPRSEPRVPQGVA